MTLRIFSKMQMYGIIKLVNLSPVIAFCLVLNLSIYDEYSYDSFHTHDDQIYALYLTKFKTDDMEIDSGIMDVSMRLNVNKSRSQNLPFINLMKASISEIDFPFKSEYNDTSIKKDGKI